MRVALALACLFILLAVCGAQQIPRKTVGRRGQGKDITSNRMRPVSPYRQDSYGPSRMTREKGTRSLDYQCDYRSDKDCVRCLDPGFAGEGVRKEYIRDGYPDCTDKSDERPRTCDVRTDSSCLGCMNKAKPGEGYFYYAECDKFKDCTDGSDENCTPKCDPLFPDGCFVCFESPFSEEAVYLDNTCDNIPHCLDNSDEYCFDSTTRGYKFCEGDCKFSVIYDVVCDGKNDSWNGEDEAKCFTCNDQSEGHHMIDLDYVCDGHSDCPDESDEWSCNNQGAGPAVVPTVTPCTSWGEWGQWSTCSKTCGMGSRKRVRSCNNLSDDESVEMCDQGVCPSEEAGSCGKRWVTQGRIVGGQKANHGEFPWQAQLLFDGSFVCGGSLYQTGYIISAAHCFQGEKADPLRWKVRLGVLDTYAFTGPDIHSSRVKKILWNAAAEYNTQTLDNDIVILILQNPVPQIPTETINSICLGTDSGATFNDGSNCFISGYGRISVDGDAATSLQAANVPLIDQNSCNIYYNGKITANMLCAGYPITGGIDSCQGDSGGPLVCSAPDGTDRWYLVGITSWGYGCAYVGYPGVYTDMSKFRQWVKTTITDYERKVMLGAN